MPIIDVVIVNWNSGDQLRAAVDSILHSSTARDAKIVVVDNGSSDHSLNGLDPDVVVVRNSTNVGFAAACNQGAALGNAEFILFFNPDAMVFEDTIAKSIEFMRRSGNADVATCGVQLIDGQGTIQRTCVEFPGAGKQIGQAFGLAALFPVRFGHFMTEFNYQQTREVDQIMGAYLLVRRAIFEKLRGFDERFFVYYEDLDLSLRAKQLGLRNVFVAETRAYHKGGGTTEQVKAHRLFYTLRARMFYALKHFSPLSAYLVCGATLFVEPLPRFVRAALRLSLAELRDTIRAFAMLWCDTPRIIRATRAKRTSV